jgi:hypothetical protein
VSKDYREAVASAYRLAVGDAGPDGTDIKAVKDTVVEWMRPKIESGLITIPWADAVRREVANVDEQHKDTADLALKAILHGQTTLPWDKDPNLSVSVTLGKGQRKALRYITAADLTAMDENRFGNVKAAVEAYDDWRENVFVPWRDALGEHWMIQDALLAGALSSAA